MIPDEAGFGQQIPLPFTQFEPLDFDLYLTGENEEVQAVLQQTAAGVQRRSVVLWGDHGSGKSHLLQATCRRAAETGMTAAYVPLKLFASHPVSVLEGLDQMHLVCIDDLDEICGHRHWEEALFHLFNRMHDQGNIMLFALRGNPRALEFQLEDLKSRLAWGLVYQLQPLADDEKIRLLQRRAETRGFKLSGEVVQYMMSRSSRDLHSLLALLDRIDSASLSEQRRITVPFVSSLLAGNGD